jgi:hypothetical protein
VRAHIFDQSEERFNAGNVDRPCVILAVEDNQHFVLPDLLADQNIYLSVYLAVPAGQVNVMQHLGRRGKLLLNPMDQQFKVAGVLSHRTTLYLLPWLGLRSTADIRVTSRLQAVRKAPTTRNDSRRLNCPRE